MRAFGGFVEGLIDMYKLQFTEDELHSILHGLDSIDGGAHEKSYGTAEDKIRAALGLEVYTDDDMIFT